VKTNRTVILWTAFIAAFAVFLVFFNKTLSYPKPGDIQTGNRYEKARILRIISDTRLPDPEFTELEIGVQTMEAEILTGENRGRRIIVRNYISRLTNWPAREGMNMILSSYDGFISGAVVNYSRGPLLYGFFLLFFAAAAFFGRKKGLKAFLALAFTLVCVVFLFIPLLIRGAHPIPAAVFVVILSTLVTMLALNGWSAKTVIASTSCILCTLAAGVIAKLFGLAAHVSTYNTPEAENLIFIAQKTSLRLQDIIFAGIIIASSGAMMDTSMSITSALFEIKQLNPALSMNRLIKSGMNVGQDIIGTMTNTLILAFTGSSINNLLVIFMYRMPYFRTVNLDLLVIETLRGLSGSIAVVLSVPLTVLLGAKFLSSGKNNKWEKAGTPSEFP
jgi:uncharacterized membrane protein